MDAITIFLAISLVLISAVTVVGAYIYGERCNKMVHAAWHYAVKTQSDMWARTTNERNHLLARQQELIDYNTRLGEYIQDSMQQEMRKVAEMPEHLADEVRTIIYTAIATQRPKTGFTPPIRESSATVVPPPSEQKTEKVKKLSGGTLSAGKKEQA